VLSEVELDPQQDSTAPLPKQLFSDLKEPLFLPQLVLPLHEKLNDLPPLPMTTTCLLFPINYAVVTMTMSLWLRLGLVRCWAQ
jgi:hypothetical protein